MNGVKKILMAGVAAGVLGVAPVNAASPCPGGGVGLGLTGGVSITKIKVPSASGNNAAGNPTVQSAMKLRKTMPFFAALLEYMARCNDVLIGIQAEFGTSFGKKAGTGTTTAVAVGNVHLVLRQQFFVMFRAVAMWMMTPNFGIGPTIGIKCQRIRGSIQVPEDDDTAGAVQKIKGKFKTGVFVGLCGRVYCTPNISVSVHVEYQAIASKFAFPPEVTTAGTADFHQKARIRDLRLGAAFIYTF
ncbi:MAG: hypothetical protein LBJ69_00965 [Holosporales bacterium]|jgi:opacity protein-like surface antigen|nr:hypothetical protein [Holosporales bacterium]